MIRDLPTRLSLGGEVIQSPSDLATSVSRFGAYLTLLAALLPYIKTSPLQTDIQPHFLAAFFGLYLWTRPKRTIADPRLVWALTIGVAYAVVLLVMENYSYALAFLFIPVFTILLTHEDTRIVDRCVKFAAVAYGVGCALELIGQRSVVNLSLANARASDTRGLHSFTSEPSYLSIIGFVLFSYFLWRREKGTWIVASAVIVLLSGAVTGIVPLVIVGLIYSLSGLNLKRVVAFSLISAVLVVMASMLVNQSSRLYTISTTAYNSPVSILDDVSASNRLIRSAGPVYLAYQDGFVPHDYQDGERLYVEWDFVAEKSDRFVDRMSNLLSASAYLLGFLALPFWIIAALGMRAEAFVVVAAIYLCLANITILTPYACLTFALLYVRPWRGDGNPGDGGIASRTIRT